MKQIPKVLFAVLALGLVVSLDSLPAPVQDALKQLPGRARSRL